MDIAIHVSGDSEELRTTARWAELLGLSTIAVPDHYRIGLAEDTGSRRAFDASPNWPPSPSTPRPWGWRCW